MKILLINTDDSMGGAAIACLRLLSVLEHEKDIEARLLVQEKKRNRPDVEAVAKGWLDKKMAFARFMAERLYFHRYEKTKEVRFAFSPANTGIDISQHPLVQEADILHLHWLNFGFLSITSLKKLFSLGKPIVWTLHDMWAFTGGCHHSGDCENYQDHCGNCLPYLRTPSPDDLSAKVWQRKNEIFGDTTQLPPVQIIGCSEWLANRARKSSLFKNLSIGAIPNPLDITVFKPTERAEARIKLNLPVDKKLILFAAAKVTVIWKGFSYFQESLQLLKEHIDKPDEIELVILGESDPELNKTLPFRTHALGRIADAEKIALIYSAADVFTIPSIQENLPNTIMEAMACGTPAVGFEVGGIPEMIAHQQTGYLARYKSAENFAEGIRWVLFKADAETLANNARRKVIENYSQEVVKEKYLGIYKRLTD
ncbi:glycosyltransferase family 4 protein [Emticicia sp. BO119]|uniref:glycosyltransferase family 4 protein n=1 Tax=Emticicia sp. BO119 TaxID=2757768 RepID=UPI0015F0EA6F|nr:glycosyltransferase family 4 protein [Emticicia sp. BO119]MBA4851297.1 glycosyltransferase [Emticicia sp. BO119]